MIADSGKPNKLRNVYTIRSTTRNVTIQNRKIYCIKINVKEYGYGGDYDNVYLLKDFENASRFKQTDCTFLFENILPKYPVF